MTKIFTSLQDQRNNDTCRTDNDIFVLDLRDRQPHTLAPVRGGQSSCIFHISLRSTRYSALMGLSNEGPYKYCFLLVLTFGRESP